MMARDRIYGSDTPFCEWMRACTELPSYSDTCGFVATDNDVTIHRYLTPVDALGTREVQSLMHIEVKTRGGPVHDSQKDTLFKKHCCMNRPRALRVKGQLVRSFGVSFLFMDNTSPDNSVVMEWGRFDRTGQIFCRGIDVATLVALLRFDIHPDTLTPQAFRRHHKTRELWVKETAPLGFEYHRPVIHRS